MTDDADVPRNLPAERAVLSSMIRSPQAVTEALNNLTVDDFWLPGHQVLWQVFADLTDAGTPIDPVVALEGVTRRGELRNAPATLIFDLHAGVALPGNVGHFMRQMKAAARRRQLLGIADRLRQTAVDASDDDALLDVVAPESLALDVLLGDTAQARKVHGLHEVETFLAMPDSPDDWLVEGMFMRQDVMLLLSTPGLGKSRFSQMLCMCLAAGWHPFRHRPVEPVRTLLVDYENPEPLLRREMRRPMSNIVQAAGRGVEGRMAVWTMPEGLNLRKRADAQLFEQAVAEARPSFIALGSLYKTFQRGRDDWDTAAEETRAVFDRVRARYRCAFLLEHHMPKSPAGSASKVTGTPFGSQVWERWPSVGRVMDTTVDGKNLFSLRPSFRGDRGGVRDLPVGLSRGDASRGQLPWLPTSWSEEDLTMEIEALSA